MFLVSAGAGAFVPRSIALTDSNPETIYKASAENQNVTIYLLTSLLHADIALPFDQTLREEFSWLDETRLPLENPNLAYLGFGWGSKAFYTTAGNYSDIGLANTFTAVTGDDAVMRVVALPKLEPSTQIIRLTITGLEYRNLIRGIKDGFAKGADKKPLYLSQYSIGQGDAFYSGTGHFNIFYPCNQWAADALFESGLKLGRWTPTTYSLLWSLRWNEEL